MLRLRATRYVGIAVPDTDAALAYFRDRLGLRVAYTEDNEAFGVRMTHLDAGNAYPQVLDPRSAEAPLVDHLDQHGEGLHQLCLAVDDVSSTLGGLAATSSGPAVIGSGRGRPAAFLPVARFIACGSSAPYSP